LLSATLPELVIAGGRVKLASADFADRLPRRILNRMFSAIVNGRPMLCDIDIGELSRATAPILGADFRLAGKRVAA
jgi:hypothetical protein